MDIKQKTIWESDVSYSNYRIPGITVTQKGTLLLYCEARRTSSDWASMDILMFRSDDGGETLNNPFIMAQGTAEFHTVNNPVCITGIDGTLHFLYCRNYSINGGDVFHRISKDDGFTWSEPENIMSATMPELHNAFALGPGHGICKTDGTLIVPVWMVMKSEGAQINAHMPSVAGTLYSTDGGECWHMGELIYGGDDILNPNESVCAECGDGSVMINIRLNKKGFRAQAYSKTGYSDWTVPELRLDQVDPTCFGSVISYRTGDKNIILLVHCIDALERKNLVCHVSYDGGKNYSQALTVESGDAGYADIAVLPDGTVCVLYEQKYGKKDILARFPLANLLNKQ
jgi:BNR/Asp-box repeat.